MSSRRRQQSVRARNTWRIERRTRVFVSPFPSPTPTDAAANERIRPNQRGVFFNKTSIRRFVINAPSPERERRPTGTADSRSRARRRVLARFAGWIFLRVLCSRVSSVRRVGDGPEPVELAGAFRSRRRRIGAVLTNASKQFLFQRGWCNRFVFVKKNYCIFQ